jgi:hypothetical protein
MEACTIRGKPRNGTCILLLPVCAALPDVVERNFGQLVAQLRHRHKAPKPVRHPLHHHACELRGDASTDGSRWEAGHAVSEAERSTCSWRDRESKHTSGLRLVHLDFKRLLRRQKAVGLANMHRLLEPAPQKASFLPLAALNSHLHVHNVLRLQP